MLKRTFSKTELKLVHYRNYKNFQFDVFKTDLNNALRRCSSSYNDYQSYFHSPKINK